MKKIPSKTALQLFVIVLILNSCSEQDKPITENERLAKIALTSQAFKDLNIQSVQLNAQTNEHSVIADGRKKSLVLPFKDGSGRLVIFKFDASNDVKLAMLFEAISESTISMEQVNNEFASNKFSGNLHITTSESNKIAFNFKNSALTGNKILKTNEARFGCGGWTDEGHGSPFSCAGRRIEQMGTASLIECYFGFFVCLAVQVADCVESGCA
jgi:hypothetical protein